MQIVQLKLIIQIINRIPKQLQTRQLRERQKLQRYPSSITHIIVSLHQLSLMKSNEFDEVTDARTRSTPDLFYVHTGYNNGNNVN